MAAATKVSGSAITHTGSAYAALDALGDPFQIMHMATNRGALITDIQIFESGSASGQIRAHFYTRQPSAVITGAQPVIHPGSGYQGYIDVTTWVSAHGSAGVGQNNSDRLAIRRESAGHVWCQLQAINQMTPNNDSSVWQVHVGVLQD